VKEIVSIAGWEESAEPASSPVPGKNESTFGGSPAARRTWTSSAATAGACSAGLSTTVFPVTSAAEHIPAGIASGKFHGDMTAHNPLAR